MTMQLFCLTTPDVAAFMQTKLACRLFTALNILIMEGSNS